MRTIVAALLVLSVAAAHAPAAPRHGIELGDGAVTIPITDAKILASVDGGAATERPVHARKDQVVMLYAAVEAGGHWYTDAPGWPHARPLAKAPHAELVADAHEPGRRSTARARRGRADRCGDARVDPPR